MRVGKEPLDPGQRLEELDEDLGVELLDHMADGIRHGLFVTQGVLQLIGIVEVLPLRARVREGIHELADRLRRKHVIDHHMGEGISGGELVMLSHGERLKIRPVGHLRGHWPNVPSRR